ncbi:MAG: acyl-CoA dehydratase activase [Syntrophobacterales bacterium]|nr:acyl-CoA dehydratase activase [Syntrophobacterales bacterium]
MFFGIDIGSRSIELVGLGEDGEIRLKRILPTTFDPLQQVKCIIEDIPSKGPIVSTGYGRTLFLDYVHWEGLKSSVTEIQACARGALVLCPGVRTVLDIGGQDTKAIALDERGRIIRFEMNDRCAAGTGKFLEFMATILQVPLEGFGDFALKATKRLKVTSMCAVFAETEATSLMARGERAEDIAMALHEAIVSRTLAMLRRVGFRYPVFFAGGVAKNRCVRFLIEEVIGSEVIVPEYPEIVGALGAAMIAMEKFSPALACG